MKKIKDNVDLKELKKFGYEKNFINDYYKETEDNYILVSKYDKEIRTDCEDDETYELLINDLIKANLTEVAK